MAEDPYEISSVPQYVDFRARFGAGDNPGIPNESVGDAFFEMQEAGAALVANKENENVAAAEVPKSAEEKLAEAVAWIGLNRLAMFSRARRSCSVSHDANRRAEASDNDNRAHGADIDDAGGRRAVVSRRCRSNDVPVRRPQIPIRRSEVRGAGAGDVDARAAAVKRPLQPYTGPETRSRTKMQQQQQQAHPGQNAKANGVAAGSSQEPLPDNKRAVASGSAFGGGHRSRDRNRRPNAVPVTQKGPMRVLAPPRAAHLTATAKEPIAPVGTERQFRESLTRRIASMSRERSLTSATEKARQTQKATGSILRERVPLPAVSSTVKPKGARDIKDHAPTPMLKKAVAKKGGEAANGGLAAAAAAAAATKGPAAHPPPRRSSVKPYTKEQRDAMFQRLSTPRATPVPRKAVGHSDVSFTKEAKKPATVTRSGLPPDYRDRAVATKGLRSRPLTPQPQSSSNSRAASVTRGQAAAAAAAEGRRPSVVAAAPRRAAAPVIPHRVSSARASTAAAPPRAPSARTSTVTATPRDMKPKRQ